MMMYRMNGINSKPLPLRVPLKVTEGKSITYKILSLYYRTHPFL
jgi:hypothetical protein